MKKKLLTIAVASTVLLFGVGVYTVLATNSSGYEIYKEALKETHKMKSAVANIELNISNNDKLLQDLTVQSIYNLEEQRGSTNINLKTSDQTIQLEINSDEKHIYIDNDQLDTTYILESKRDSDKMRERHERVHNKELMKVAELVVDTLTRPLHDSFVIGPENTISVDVTNDEIPTAIHAIGSYMVKKASGHHANMEMTMDDYPFLTRSYQQEFPNLTDEITFEQIKVDAQLTEAGLMKNQQAIFRISGKDQEGKSHTLDIQLDFSFENINETTLPPLNLDGKKLETIELKKGHHFH
ncbi:hypothetical protein RJD24_03040 [Bacillaceae bacterium IKA-2]|nr:hypothetical protein RJD24_03040 [Bacillaceae bacterium IKA-2]